MPLRDTSEGDFVQDDPAMFRLDRTIGGGKI